MLSKIKAIVFDIDGVLTDGRIVYDNAGNEWKNFNVKDGMLMGVMRKLGYHFGTITGRESEIVSKRMAELKVEFVHQGVQNKLKTFRLFLNKYNLKPEEVAYLGDDLNDIAIMRYAGIGACPADAVLEVKRTAHLVLQAKGGEGVLREFCERVLKAREQWDDVVRHFNE